MKHPVFHVVVILVTGVIIGLIVRSRRQAQFAQADREASAARIEPAVNTPVIVAEGWLSEFELTERSGRQVTSDELLGSPYIVSFFFTTCPSTCPRQNEMLKILEQEFKEDDVHFLSISCDPEIDTPEVLAEYAERFDADKEKWLFLTGDLTYIRRVGAEVFQLPVDRRFHTDRFVLVNAEGEIVAFYEWPEQSQFDQLKVDLRKLLEGQKLTDSEDTKT